jgi:hypothetical protein
VPPQAALCATAQSTVTCFGFSRFRRIFAGFSPRRVRLPLFDRALRLIPLTAWAQCAKRAQHGRSGRSNAARKRPTSGVKATGMVATDIEASGTQPCPKKALQLRSAAAPNGAPIRVWQPSPALRARIPRIGELACLAYPASAGSPQPSTG